MDVISKEGPLLLQGVKFGKKIWRKIWLVVFEPSPAGIGRIEMYDMRDGGGRLGFAIAKPPGLKKTDKRVIRLSDCLSITPAPGESCPKDYSAFFLNTTSCTYTIANPKHEDWISVLCRLAFQKSNGDEDTGKPARDQSTQLSDNELYSTWGAGQFQVMIQSTDASQRCRMFGSYLLSADKESICLLDLKTGQAIHHWPYNLLRRFGKVKGGIMIEAGRRCQTGEGQFIFLSKQGLQIHRAIEEAIMHQSVQELLAKATAVPQESPSQPPSPGSKTQDRSEVNKLAPINMTQERPRPAVQRKQGQQIHKAIEDVLMHHSGKDRLVSSTTPQKDSRPSPPPSPKPKTQDCPKDKPKVNKHSPICMNQEKLCPPVIQKHSQPINRAGEKALKHNNVQKLLAQSNPLPQAPQPPPRPAVPRRKIFLPDTLSIKSPPNSPDDVIYASILLQPKPRSQMNLPKVPTPPSLPPTFRVDIKKDTGVGMDKEWNSSQEPSENKVEDNPYTNWTAKTTAEQDQPSIEALYSTVNFAAKYKNRHTEDIGEQEQPNIDQQTFVIPSTEIPGDFKQTLSNILFKELSKTPPAVPSRSLGGYSDHLEGTDDQMTD